MSAAFLIPMLAVGMSLGVVVFLKARSRPADPANKKDAGVNADTTLSSDPIAADSIADCESSEGSDSDSCDGGDASGAD